MRPDYGWLTLEQRGFDRREWAYVWVFLNKHFGKFLDTSFPYHCEAALWITPDCHTEVTLLLLRYQCINCHPYKCFLFKLSFRFWCLALVTRTPKGFRVTSGNNDAGTDRQFTVRNNDRFTALGTTVRHWPHIFSSNFLSNSFFPDTYFIISTWHMTHVNTRMCVHQLLALLAEPLSTAGNDS